MLASYTQTHGPSQGWFFDPDTMKLMFDSPAMTEVVDIMKVSGASMCVCVCVEKREGGGDRGGERCGAPRSCTCPCLELPIQQARTPSISTACFILVLQGLFAISPPDNSLPLGCPSYNYRFTGPTGGQCLMSIIHPFAFKVRYTVKRMVMPSSQHALKRYNRLGPTLP